MDSQKIKNFLISFQRRPRIAEILNNVVCNTFLFRYSRLPKSYIVRKLYVLAEEANRFRMMMILKNIFEKLKILYLKVGQRV